MAVSYKVLGQIEPAAATNTTAYTVPTGSGNYAVISTISVVNLSTSVDAIRIAVRPAGATLEDKHYVVYDQSLAAYQSVFYTIGITVASTDVITVRSLSGTSAFNIFGSENS
jgi:hypothetical protein